MEVEQQLSMDQLTVKTVQAVACIMSVHVLISEVQGSKSQAALALQVLPPLCQTPAVGKELLIRVKAAPLRAVPRQEHPAAHAVQGSKSRHADSLGHSAPSCSRSSILLLRTAQFHSHTMIVTEYCRQRKKHG
jgi:hypothetical protein